MSDLLLAKPKNLPEGFIDVSVGEAHIVRHHLAKTFDLGLVELQMLNALVKAPKLYEYPLSTGYQPLVDLLEKRHGASVVITNGAKQGLSSCFFALGQMGKHSINLRSPYWALIPPLARLHQLEIKLNEEGGDAHLSVSPNNPDGFIKNSDTLLNDVVINHVFDIPFIHDAAYFSHTYLPRSYQLTQIGDAQIYSISKMFGLSGLRLGYVVCPNPHFYRHIQQYVETTTVGVSVFPQIFLEKLMSIMRDHPELLQQFEDVSRQSLTDAKEIMLGISPDVLEIPSNFPDIPGMFLWAKMGPACNLTEAKINAIDGALFGQPGFVRMNLAFDLSTIRDIVYRLNCSKGK